MHKHNFPSRRELLAHAATAIDHFLWNTGLTRTEFCVKLKLYKRTFERFLENRNESKGVGHTKLGPIKMLRVILEQDEVRLPDEVVEAIRRLVYYSDYCLRK